ncbi:Protein rdm16 [Ancistrocladus abbreviatus]
MEEERVKTTNRRSRGEPRDRERERERDSHKDYKDKGREREKERERDRRSKDQRSKERDNDGDSSSPDLDHYYHHRTRDDVSDASKNRVSSSRLSKEYKHKHEDDAEYHRPRARSHDRESRREKSYDEHRRSSREYSEEEEDRDSRREGSRDRAYDRERSYGREDSGDRGREREELGHSHKRKDRGDSVDRRDLGGEKRIRVSDDGVKEEKKERRRFEDKVDGEAKGLSEFDKEERRDKDLKEERREKRKFEDKVKEDDIRGSKVEAKVKKEGGDEEDVDNGRRRERRKFEDREAKEEMKVKEVTEGKRVSGSISNGALVGSLNTLSRNPPEMLASFHPPTKVSSISTTNENKGVSITGSHEVTGKSSTDGTTTAAGNSGNSSLDALAKAKKALQLQKELSEKLKKLPLLNKGAGSKADSIPRVSSVEGVKAPTTAGILPTPSLTAALTNSSGAGSTSAIPAAVAAAASMNPPGGMDAAKYEAVKRAQELVAKMGFRQDPEFPPLINFFPGQIPPDVSVLQKPAKAPVLRLDALGREIDEHGNVVNVTKPNNLSTLKVNINKQKKEAFQILKPDLDVDPEQNPHFDTRMGINKNKILRPKRMTFQFVEEGKWSKDAEIIKLKNQFGEAQAKELKAKQAQLAKAKAEPNINPNLIEVSERVITKEKPKEPIPEVEWWDVGLLRSDEYTGIADGDKIEDKIKMEKITIYVEHPRPIEPPAEPAPPPPQPLKLTKKEQKKLRTQRRLAREKERQEMIRQGLLEPPKPKVKMSNLMKVLGSEATQAPTKYEEEIRAAAAEREQAHIDRNIARKLTPAERREKKERKLFDDPSALETIVSVYKINDLSHPQNRFKVDVNAQENRLTGCAVISEGFSVVVVEGGSKSIKRYGKLMLRRINWAAKVENEDEEEDDEEGKPANKCVLVWQGSAAKPGFNKFLIHECRTEAAARKVFADAGVGHYWDLAANFSDDRE